MPHSIEQIETLLDSYELLANQKQFLLAALDSPGTQISVLPVSGIVVTYIPVYNMDWLRDNLELLIAAIDARRLAIRNDLEA